MQQKFFLLLLITFSQSIFAQQQTRDSISLQDLKPFSYDFSIEDGLLKGAGAKILSEAVADVQVTMLGVNGRSKLEAELAQALLKELDQHAYKTIVLEAGRASGAVIRKLTKEPAKTLQKIKALNKKYAFDIKDLTIAPIPEVRTVEAGQLVQCAAERDWSILSIGTEYWTGYKMIADELYENLSATNKPVYQQSYQETIRLLDKLYKEINGQGNEDILRFTSAIKSSEVFDKFLQEMSICEANLSIIKAIQFSVDYWHLYGNREMYKKNKLNSRKNKERLAEEFKIINFDISQDKVFVQMWKNHMVKGTTPNGFYGVGNTLHEIAEMNGSSSLNIGIVPRYSEENGEIIDALATGGYWINGYMELIPLGKKDEWVLIDIRPFNEKFHWGPYHLSPQLSKIITRFDMIIIPKLNKKATINY